jgi:hypothetical protein
MNIFLCSIAIKAYTVYTTDLKMIPKSLSSIITYLFNEMQTQTQSRERNMNTICPICADNSAMPLNFVAALRAWLCNKKKEKKGGSNE